MSMINFVTLSVRAGLMHIVTAGPQRTSAQHHYPRVKAKGKQTEENVQFIEGHMPISWAC